MQENQEIKGLLKKIDVTKEDIQDISKELNIPLTPEQLEIIYNEYNREVMDKGESWDRLIEILIMKEGTKEFLKGLNNK